MPRIEGDFAELLHAVATGRLGETSARAFAAPRDDGDRRRPRLSRDAGKRRADPGDRGRRAGAGSHRFPRRYGAIGDGGLVAKGGRVLAVTAVADTFANARARAYRAVDQIDFADGFHRRDIGWRELERRAKERWQTNEPVLGPLLASLGRRRRRRRPRPERSHSGESEAVAQYRAGGRHCRECVVPDLGLARPWSEPATASPMRSNRALARAPRSV